jgi:CubicO group peptidase (beta-lactamase class C family)
MTDVTIHGATAPGFERVADALRASFREHGEVGASLSVVVDGETKVDIWAGHADKARTRLWERDTIVNLYSTTKGIAAVAAAILVDRGQLDVEQPVAHYWPEFAQAGKEDIPVKWLLSHQAGLPAIDEPLPPGGALDWQTVIHALERQKLEWTPGAAMGYHAITYGWLVGEVTRRISGLTPGAFVRKELAEPLGIDLFIGTSAAEDPRTAEMIPPEGRPALATGPDPNSLPARALGIASPPAGADVNSRAWRAAELPAANGHGNARALARMYGALARGGEIDGVRLMGQPTIVRFTTEEANEIDRVIGFEVRRGLGFILSAPPGGRYHWGPNATAFGHSGAGGSLGFADPETKLGFGYAMNQMTAGLSADPRWAGLIDSVYACL